MKTNLILLVAGLLWLPGGVLFEARSGQAAPEFTGTDIQGKTHRLSDYRGKVVVLEAYNPECPFCANHYRTGAMQALQASAVSRGVCWLVVNSTPASSPAYRKPDAALKDWATLGMKATAWIDDSSGAIGRKYNLKTATHMVVIDAEGVIAYQGAIDDRPANSGDPRTARNYVRQAIEALLAGKPVATSTSAPYGSAIKYAP